MRCSRMLRTNLRDAILLRTAIYEYATRNLVRPLSSRTERPLQCGTAAHQSAPENEQGGDEPPALGGIQSPSATDKATRDAVGTNLRTLGRVGPRTEMRGHGRLDRGGRQDGEGTSRRGSARCGAHRRSKTGG